MAFCTQCGMKLPKAAVFCPNCGGSSVRQPEPPTVREEKAAGGQTTDAASPPAAPKCDFGCPPAFHKRATPKKTGTGGKPAVLILSILTVLLAAAAIFVWSRAGSGLLSPVPRPIKTPGTVAGSGYVDQDRYYITVNGAEQFTDLDGDSALRIYFEFTNENRAFSSVSAGNALRIQARQDGKELGLTYSIENEAVDSAGLSIRPGVTIQAGVSFKYKPDGGVVDVDIFGRAEDEAGGVVSATYLPENLPGAPPPFIAAPVDTPNWMEGLSHQGEMDAYFISIYDAMPIRDIRGNPAIRIYYAFSNKSTAEISLNTALSAVAYQDGIALTPTYTEPEPEQDSAYYENAAPGDTMLTSRVFRLRNTRSPVEAMVEAKPESYDKSVAVGKVFEIR